MWIDQKRHNKLVNPNLGYRVALQLQLLSQSDDDFRVKRNSFS